MSNQLDVRPAPARVANCPPAPRRRRGWVTAVGILLVIGLVGFLGWRLFGPAPQRTARPAGGPPQTVGVATIATGDLDVVMTGLGAVTPLATVTVVTQINGQLTDVAFAEGQAVHKGDFLAQIDPRPYQVALEQAQGTLAHDQGLLAQARADNARYQLLNKQDSIARQQVEDQAYLIKQYEGTVLTDQGLVDSAKLNLAYCHITSPVDGRVGIRLVDPGNYVQTSNTAGLFVLTQLQPMSVIFTLPEDDVAEVQSQMAKASLPVMAYDRTNTKLIATGTLATTDNQIDSTTGTLKLRAMFNNADNALFPQAFVNARLRVRTIKDAVVAPQAAVQHGAPGDFVYLVKPDDTVAVQVVKLGVTQADRVQVTDGLHAGDKVVTDGLDRLRDGAKIMVAGAPRANSGQGGDQGGARAGRTKPGAKPGASGGE